MATSNHSQYFSRNLHCFRHRSQCHSSVVTITQPHCRRHYFSGCARYRTGGFVEAVTQWKQGLWLFLTKSQAVLQLLSLCSSQELEGTGVQEEDHASGDVFRRLNHSHILWRSVSVCVSVCIRVSICIYICMYVHSCVVCVYVCVYIYVGICVNMCVCMCVQAYLSVYMFLWWYMCMSMCMYISLCVYTNVCVSVIVCFRENKEKLEKENTF